MSISLRSLGASLAAIVLFIPSANAEECWNRGVIEKTKFDRPEKSTFSGDIKSVSSTFDYENNSISGKITWNRIPSSSQTTYLTIGFVQNGTGDCVTVTEQYKMKAWSKKFSRDRESMPGGYSADMMGTLRLTSSNKNSISFEWFEATINDGDYMDITCVRVATSSIQRFYKSNTTCITMGNITNCDGPGWYSGPNEFEYVNVWAGDKWADIDIACTTKT